MRRFTMILGCALVAFGATLATAQEQKGPAQAPKAVQAPVQAPKAVQAPVQAPKAVQAPTQKLAPVQKPVQAPVQKHAVAAQKHHQAPIQKGEVQAPPKMARAGLFRNR